MKKIITSIGLLLIYSFSSAQSQRLQLIEEVTGEKCGPCASVNPGFNALLNQGANPSKIIAIKYQAQHGGSPPFVLYSGVAATDVTARRGYYSNTSAPHCYHDGNVYNGNPGNFNQTKIDNQQPVTSPFDIVVSHSFSPEWDSIYVTATITASQAVTGSLKARVAVIENEIHFLTPPGTNGEKDFEEVMRKMLPNANGTTLPTSWTLGQTQTINLSWKMVDIYDLNEVAVVAFVQDDADKNVKQAAKSQPLSLASYAGVTAISNIPVLQCNTTITPSVTVKNHGTNTLTSATINYKVDNGTVSTQNWTGSLAPGATTTAVLPAITVTGGSHVFTSFISSPNGQAVNVNVHNVSESFKFNILLSAVAGPLVESFQSLTFPGPGYIAVNPDGGATWTRVTNAGGFGNSSASAKMDIYNSPSGQVDELFVPTLDFSTTPTPITLDFSVAYAQYQSENDKLEVFVSTNCGTTWSSVFNKSGGTLSTATSTTSPFTPNSQQWRTETGNLDSYAGQSDVMIKFKVTSAYGNNLFLDDINIGSFTGIKEDQEALQLNVFPNPASQTVFIQYIMENKEKVFITVIDGMGRILQSENVNSMTTGVQSHIIDVSNYSTGIYYLQLTSGNNTVTKKINVIK